MGSTPASHQFSKSSGAAEEHLRTKPPYAWRLVGAGHTIFGVLLCQPGQGIWVAEEGGKEQENAVFLAMRHRPKVL